MIEYSPGNPVDKKNILVVDDHSVIRRGLTELLNQQPDLTVCDAVATAEQALNAMNRVPVDLAIIDISLGQEDGIALTTLLKQKYPGLTVLILSMCDEQFYGPRALRAGASGFVAKHETSDTLLEAIYQVLSGRTYFRPAG